MATSVSSANLQSAIQRFHTGRVLVVGDFAIDEMIYGTTERLSREAPVVILRHQRTDILLGAGANAAHNVAALLQHPAQPTLGAVQAVGLCGTDEYAPKLQTALETAGIATTGLLPDATRATTTKTRLSGIANHSVTQQIVRVDREDRHPVQGAMETALLDTIAKHASSVDALLLSDYALGVVTEPVIAACQQVAKAHNLVFSADSHHPLHRFAGATIVTPNQPEAEQNLGYALNTWESRLRGGQTLLEQTGVQHLLLTLGGDGMMLFHRPDPAQPNDIWATPIPVFNRSEVFDVTGAGDTVIGTLTLALATGASLVEAAVLGNLAASLVVRKFGTAVTNITEVSDALARLTPEVLARIESRPVSAWLTMPAPVLS